MSSIHTSYSSNHRSSPSFVELSHALQVQEQLSPLKSPELKQGFLKNLLCTDGLYRKLLTEVQACCNQAKKGEQGWQQVADKAYRAANNQLQELKNEPSTKMLRAFYEGHVARAFLDLDNTLSKKSDRPLHRYCGCNVLEGDLNASEQMKLESPSLLGRPARYLVPYPEELKLDAKLLHRSVLTYSWSYGGGHDGVQNALAQRYAIAGMHVYNIQIDDELLDCDPLWNLTGARYCTRDLLGYLMTNSWWKTIRFINWYFSGAPKPSEEEKRIRSFVQIMLTRGTPDVSVSCLARYVGSMEKASARLGIPHCNMPSDLDPELFDLQRGSDVENPYFAHGIAVRDAHLNARITLPDRMLADVGLSVRPAIMKKYSVQEVAAIRKKWGIESDRHVVIVLAGRDGVKNQCAEQILHGYGQDAPKIHLLVVCGNNKAEYDRLQAAYGDFEDVAVLKFLNEMKMGELYAMASDSNCRGALVSAKGGGGTLMEAIAAGVPLLVSDLNGLHWERENISFIERQNLGTTFRTEQELVFKLEETLTAPYHNPYLEIDSERKSLQVLDGLISAAEQDVPFKAAQKAALSAKLVTSESVEASQEVLRSGKVTPLGALPN